MTRPSTLAAFAHRNFRLFWSGQLVSLVGTWMQTVAQGWLVLTLTDDPLALGIAATCQFLPVLLFGLFGGLIADALPKRATLVATQFVSLLLAAVLGVLVATKTVEVWHVYLLAVGLGLVTAVDMPVRQAFVIEMVGREHVANAVALNSAVFNGARIIGPAAAGLLIGAAGMAACFFLNAASYLAVLVAYLLMRSAELRPAPRMALAGTVRGVLAQLGEGLRYVRRTPSIRLVLLTLGIVATAGMNFSVLIPVYARDVLGGDAGTFGFLMAATGAGSLLSALWIASGLRPSARLVVVGAAALGCALAAVSFVQEFALALPLMVVVGWSVIAMAASTNTMVQLTVPDELRGRVVSIYTTIFAGSTPIGGLIAGSIAGALGVGAALLAGGAVALATAALAATRLSSLPSGGVRPASQGVG